MTMLVESLEIGDRQFDQLSALVKASCGINLHDGKKQLVQGAAGQAAAAARHIGL